LLAPDLAGRAGCLAGCRGGKVVLGKVVLEKVVLGRAVLGQAG